MWRDSPGCRECRLGSGSGVAAARSLGETGGQVTIDIDATLVTSCARGPDRCHGGVHVAGEVGDQPRHRRVRGDRPKHLRLRADDRDVGQAVAAERDRARHVHQHLARVMDRPTRPPRRQRRRRRPGQPGDRDRLAEQHSA